MIVAGIDEAGRGPVLGPLVITGVVAAEDDISSLIMKGLNDSKLLSKKKREILVKEIQPLLLACKTVIISAKEIDEKRLNITLNQIELSSMISILNFLPNWSKAYVDACDINAERFQTILRNNVNENVIAEHFADKKYPIVSAASILAKVVRDNEIAKLHTSYGIDFGSGYPSDPKTTSFLDSYIKTHGDLPDIARKSWITSKRKLASFAQSKLDALLPFQKQL